MKNIEIFEKHATEYDEWFKENEGACKSEILSCETPAVDAMVFFFHVLMRHYWGASIGFVESAWLKISLLSEFVPDCAGEESLTTSILAPDSLQ